MCVRSKGAVRCEGGEGGSSTRGGRSVGAFGQGRHGGLLRAAAGRGARWRGVKWPVERLEGSPARRA